MKNIDQIIEKYFDAETSEVEETQLREFFTSDSVPEKYLMYKGYFSSLENKPDVLGDDFDLKISESIEKNGKKNFMSQPIWRFAVAASIIMVIGITTLPNFFAARYEKDTFQDPEQAYMETKRALMLVSEKLNQGMTSVESLSKFNEAKNKLPFSITE